MLIVTAGTGLFHEMIQATLAKAKECGYDTKVYDLGGLEEGEPFCADFPETIKGYTPKFPDKPRMLQKLLGETEDFVVYLDGDAVLVDGIDEVAEGDYSIGYTHRETDFERHTYPAITSFLNAGVVFLRPTEITRTFLHEWVDLTKKCGSGSDQEALTTLVQKPKYREHVQGFDCRTYNFIYWPENPKGAKILHFKAGWKGEWRRHVRT